MKCLRCNCNKEMKPVNLISAPASGIYLTGKDKAVGSEKKSRVQGYVCTMCGYVELEAKNPDIFN